MNLNVESITTTLAEEEVVHRWVFRCGCSGYLRSENDRFTNDTICRGCRPVLQRVAIGRKRPFVRCQCRDRQCAVHVGQVCSERAVSSTFRPVYREDNTPVRFCGQCARDALRSGAYA